jgi:hypothetical protein
MQANAKSLQFTQRLFNALPHRANSKILVFKKNGGQNFGHTKSEPTTTRCLNKRRPFIIQII